MARISGRAAALCAALVAGGQATAQSGVGTLAAALPSVPALAASSPSPPLCDPAAVAPAAPCLDWTLLPADAAPYARQAATAPEGAAAPAAEASPYGPVLPQDAASAADAGDPAPQRVSFGRQIGSVKWEIAAATAYLTTVQLVVLKDPTSFHFQDEGWFGKNTSTMGIDKLAHAFNAYMISDFIQHRIQKRTGASRASSAVTAAIVGTGLQLYGELYDAHKPDGGFSYQDVLMNMAGSGFSVLRNSVPGLREKLDFRLEIVPNRDIYTPKGRRHFAQQRYLFALTLAGFDRFRDSPLRFLELHAGYYADNITRRDERLGRERKRKMLFGVGINLKELFFRRPKSDAARIAGSVLDYIQVPYTSIHGETGI